MLTNILTELYAILRISQERLRYESARNSSYVLYFMILISYFLFIIGEVCMLRTQSHDQFNHRDFNLQVCTYSSRPYAMQAPVSPHFLSIAL